jgi:hypothetical protein
MLTCFLPSPVSNDDADVDGILNEVIVRLRNWQSRRGLWIPASDELLA